MLFTTADGRQLAGIPGLSLGILSAAQGSYSRTQFLLDLTQGARIDGAAYDSSQPPALSIFAPASVRTARPGGLAEGAKVAGWNAARSRARQAPQLLEPGLLAGAAGGAGYAGVSGQDDLDAVLAAAPGGQIGLFSLGSPRTLLARLASLRRGERLTVADLPGGAEGLADLRTLVAARGPSALVIVLQRARGEAGPLLWGAVAGLAGAGAKELTSSTTHERALIASIDAAPTILAHLGLPVPAEMRGGAISSEGRLDPAGLSSLRARLGVIGGRRLRALGLMLCALALLLLACTRSPPARARALRLGALGMLWAPAVALIPAALEPSAAVEYLLIVGVCFALAALSDALVPWPRAPLAPALAAIAALTADALGHTQLLMRSLLGPDPSIGARFYGIGNELKSALAVLVLAAVAALLYPAARGRGGAATFACAGAVLALIEGSARIGAGAGGVILVSAGFALAAVLMLPGAITRRRALALLGAPIAGLLVLAAVDLASAHGSGHFTGSVLHARSAGDIRDLIVRRYQAAWRELSNHAMPAATVLALACSIVAIARRDRLLAPVRSDPAFGAALAGGLAAGIVGALVEDSGPLLFVTAAFTLGCLASYLWGRAPAPMPALTSSRAQPGRRSLAGGPVQRDLVL